MNITPHFFVEKTKHNKIFEVLKKKTNENSKFIISPAKKQPNLSPKISTHVFFSAI